MDTLQQLAGLLLNHPPTEQELETHSETLDRVPTIVTSWTGDMKKLYILADRMEQLGKALRNEVKTIAGTEMSMIYGDEKKQTLYGNTLTYSESNVYEYFDNPVTERLNTDLEEVDAQMKPFKKKEKEIKKAIKSEHDRQVATGEARLVGTDYKISISRK